MTSLLKTVKSVEDEAAKGSRAIEQTVNSINLQVKVSFVVMRKLKEILNLLSCFSLYTPWMLAYVVQLLKNSFKRPNQSQPPQQKRLQQEIRADRRI